MHVSLEIAIAVKVHLVEGYTTYLKGVIQRY